MHDLDTIRRLLAYSDWANDAVLKGAALLSDAELDRPLEIGPGAGTLRRILTHTWAGEEMWLRRWHEEPPADLKWPDESVPLTVAEVRTLLEGVASERKVFIEGLDPARLWREHVYRDSKGSLFRALLVDMLLQGIVHSAHHRAQAVNALRRLGAAAPEVDYMMHLRKPVV